jgi:hypothetical protein
MIVVTLGRKTETESSGVVERREMADNSKTASPISWSPTDLLVGTSKVKILGDRLPGRQFASCAKQI